MTTNDITTCQESEDLLVQQSAAGLDPTDTGVCSGISTPARTAVAWSRPWGSSRRRLSPTSGPAQKSSPSCTSASKPAIPWRCWPRPACPPTRPCSEPPPPSLLLLATESSGPQAIQPAALVPTVAPTATPADSYEVMANVHLLKHQRLGRVPSEDSLLINYPTSIGSI